MSLSARERQAEERRLGRTLAEIERQLEEWRAVERGRRAGVRKTRTRMWEELPSQVQGFDDAIELSQGLQELSREERSLREARQRLRQLERMGASPYFGRCDFRPDGQQEPRALYIGIGSLRAEERGEHLVFDWRAPIASLYYDFEPGPARYDAPAGTVAGQVTRKRQFRIREGRLEEAFDSSMHIADEVLQTILARSSGGRMRSIVQTIQRSQNRIIRDEDSRLLIVQGAAGSGKSSIALHRVAYLLYRHRPHLRAEHILVISPNLLFSSYTANVLPELGEEPMTQTTFHALATGTLGGEGLSFERRHQHMERLLVAQEDQGGQGWVAGLRWKGSPAFLQLLERYREYLEAGTWVAWDDLTYDDEPVMAAQELETRFREDYAYLPVERRAAKLKRRAFQELDRHRAGRGASPAPNDERTSEPPLDLQRAQTAGEPDSAEDDGVDRELVEAMHRLDAMLAVDPVGAYRRLLTDGDLLEYLGDGLSLPKPSALARSLGARTLPALASGRVPYEDVAPLMYLYAVLRGLPDRPGIRHVLVDEAQDYSLCEYAVLARLLPNSRFTLLGDRNQSIYPHTSIADYRPLPHLLGLDGAVQVTLTRSYRSTEEIVNFSRALLPDGEPVEGVARSGARPVVVELSSDAERAGAVARELERQAALRRESAAVIVRTRGAAEELAAQLKARGLRLRHVTPDDDWVDGMVVLPCYVAKGLEFEAVLVPDAEAYDLERALDRYLLYTACTRAMHELRLFIRSRPGWLERLDPALYVRQQAQPRAERR